MPYIGRAATNAGSVNYLDDISSGFDGSDTTFTCAVKGTTITPGQENVYIYLDGVFQHPGESYTISGSTITFTEAPVSGVDFTAYVAGEGAYLDDGTVSTAKLDDDAVTASKVDDDGTGFQVGDLGVGGSLTSGDKLTVTGRLRASGGIIGDLTGDVTGDLTGDVTGNLTGNVTGNTSGSAATVTQAAQTAITSVGTLSSLTLGGDLTLPQKIVHSGDTDTYLSFGTDSLSLYTGGTNVVDFIYGNIYIKGNNKALTGYTTGGGAKELIKIDSSDVVQIGEGLNTTFAGNVTIGGTLQSDDFTLDAGSGNPDLVIKTTASSSATAQMLFLTGDKDFTLINDTDNFRLYNSTPGVGVDVIKVIGSSSDILLGDVGNSRHVSLDYSNGDFVANQRLGVGVVPPCKFTVKSGGSGAIANGIGFYNAGDTNFAAAIFEENTNPTSGELRLYAGGVEKVYLRANSSSTNAFLLKGGIMQDITANNTGIQFRFNADTGFINRIDNNFDGASAASSYMRFKVASASGSQSTALTLKGDGTMAVSADTPAYAAVIQNNQGDGAVLDLYASASDDHAFDPIFKVRTDAQDLFMIDNRGNWYSGDNFVSNPWDLSSGEGGLYFQTGAYNEGQIFALANNQDRGYAVYYSNAINADSSDGRHIQWMNDGTPAGHVHFASSNSVAYNTTQSDKTLKKNFADWTENILDSFDKINPQLFHFKIQDDSEEKVKGFIAQEMVDKFPEAYPMGAYGEGDDKKTKYHFNPSGMVVYLMKAVKELSDKIKVLEAK